MAENKKPLHSGEALIFKVCELLQNAKSPPPRMVGVHVLSSSNLNGIRFQFCIHVLSILPERYDLSRHNKRFMKTDLSGRPYA
jgi:hypothetical protein